MYIPCENMNTFFFQGVTYPSIHAIWAKWAPPMEKTRLAAFAFSGLIWKFYN